MVSIPSRISLIIASVVSVTALATAPAAAQSPNGNASNDPSSTQLCTGAKSNFKCAPQQLPVDLIKSYMQGKGSPTDQAALDQKIKDIEDTLNKGNGAPGTTGWQGFGNGKPGSNNGKAGSGNGSTTPPDLGQLKDLATKFLGDGGGNGNSSSNNGYSGGSNGNGSSTSSGNQGNGNGNTGSSTGGNGNNNGGNANGNGNGNTNGGSSSGQNPTQRCEQMQDLVNKRVADLNKRAQASLANLDDTMKKLQDYQSQIDQSQLPADYQDIVTKALDAQQNSTTAVATMAALNIKIDCTQPNPAQSLSVIKTSTDATRTQLKDFATSLRTMATDLANKAKN